MTPHDWLTVLEMAGSALVAVLGVTWYLASRLTKQDGKIQVIETKVDMLLNRSELRRDHGRADRSGGHRAHLRVLTPDDDAE